MKVIYNYSGRNMVFNSIVDVINYFEDNAEQDHNAKELILDDFNLDNWLYHMIDTKLVLDKTEKNLLSAAIQLKECCTNNRDCVTCMFYDIIEGYCKIESTMPENWKIEDEEE